MIANATPPSAGMLLFFVGMLCSFPAPAQDIDMAEVSARDEFRWGVLAYHAGLYNEAILAFERSLSYKADDPRTRTWLGRAYYRSGFTEEALHIWQEVIDAGNASPVLRRSVEVVENRVHLARELEVEERYVVLTDVTGRREDYRLFHRPSSVVARRNGRFFVVSYGTNEVVEFDQNAAVVRRLRGGLEGFDHPFDVLELPDGSLYVTEHQGDRVAKCRPDGTKTAVFGDTGRGAGQLLGPQYLAADAEGYVYVTDWGNQRVVKFDPEGRYVLSFGDRRGEFPGLRGPSGIAVIHDTVYVADARAGVVYAFDLSGNHLAELGTEALRRPEGLTVYDGTRLLVADTSRIVALDTEYDTVRLVSDAAGDLRRVLRADVDSNGNIVAVDFDADRVLMLSELSEMYTGLFVQIDRVNADEFPTVEVDVTVEDRLGEPVVGLDESNFLLSEGRQGVVELTLGMAADTAEIAEVAVLMDRSPELDRPAAARAVRELYAGLAGRGRTRLITAGETPVVEAGTGTSAASAVAAAVEAGEYSEDWRFDLGLRLAASELVPSRGKRAVLFVTQGRLHEQSFLQYDLVELKDYLAHNDLAFYPIYLGGESSEELEYLARETGGRSFPLLAPEGLRPVPDHVLQRQSGSYVFTYQSALDTEFGRRYLPMEVEVFHISKSGRDESGYFAPLEF